ncbi:MAG TPA: hypothetical protein PLQ67_09860 [Burkholderiaceae bacterium]|nr:hypothetical protein [Burkholderiaceae bacterium]
MAIRRIDVLNLGPMQTLRSAEPFMELTQRGQRRAGSLATAQSTLDGRANISFQRLPKHPLTQASTVPPNYHRMVAQTASDAQGVHVAQLKKTSTEGLNDARRAVDELFKGAPGQSQNDVHQRMLNAVEAHAKEIRRLVDSEQFVISRPSHQPGHKPGTEGFAKEQLDKEFHKVDVDALRGKHGDRARDAALRQLNLNMALIKEGVFYAVPAKTD